MRYVSYQIHRHLLFSQSIPETEFCPFFVHQTRKMIIFDVKPTSPHSKAPVHEGRRGCARQFVESSWPGRRKRGPAVSPALMATSSYLCRRTRRATRRSTTPYPRSAMTCWRCCWTMRLTSPSPTTMASTPSTTRRSAEIQGKPPAPRISPTLRPPPAPPRFCMYAGYIRESTITGPPLRGLAAPFIKLFRFLVQFRRGRGD